VRARLRAALLTLLCVGVLTDGGTAGAKEVRLPKPHLGVFTETKGVAVDQGTHDVYAIDGRSEVQQIKVSATGGKAKLTFGAGAPVEVNFNASASQVGAALTTLICPGSTCLFVNGGLATSGGSVVNFQTTLATTDVKQIGCESGTPPLSGGTGCTVETKVNGVSGAIARYHADGTSSDFSALGSNRIDGRAPDSDQTPQGGLHFDVALISQIAVDNSGATTDGEIYATQFGHQLVDIFSPSGEFKGQLTEFKEGVVFKPLQNVCGVAVDPSGNVYVADLSTGIHKYEPSGDPVTNADSVANFTTVELPCTMAAGAGPTAGFLLAGGLNGGLFKLDASTGEVKYEVSKNSTTTVTVDPTSGHVLSPRDSAKGKEIEDEKEIREFDASGTSSASLLGTFAAGSETRGVAVDGTTGKGGTLYVSRARLTHLDVYGPFVELPLVETKAAGPLGGTMATLNGTISADGGPDASCRFEYLSEATFLAQEKAAEEAAEPKTEEQIAEAAFAGAASAPCEPPGPYTGSSVNEVSAEATGLNPEIRFVFRIVGENANGQIAAASLPFETLGKPLIEGGEASEVSATTALISGTVNARGAETEVAVQYVTEEQFEESEFAAATSVAGANLPPAPPGPQPVSVQLTGLTPDTPYIFRIVAQSSAGIADPGKAGRFATFPPLDLSLPDDRAYEQVTPAQKIGEPYVPEPDLRAGLGGSCKSCTPGWDKPRMPMQASPVGDAVAYEGDPFEEGLAGGANEYRSRRNADGWQTTGLSTPLFRDDGYEDAFRAFSADLTKAILVQTHGSLTPEAPPGFANLYLQEEGRAGLATLIEVEPQHRSNEGANRFLVTYAGADAGTEAVEPFSQVIFQANDALTEEDPGIAPEAPPVDKEETNLYEWSDGELHLVNVLPGNGEAAPDAVFGSGLLLALGDNENFNFDHAISDDGSRIFWSRASDGQVFVREGGTSTIEVPDPGGFLTATPDGSKVLLDDGMLYDLGEEALTDLSSGAGGFEGLVGKSEDLSRIYFVDTEALTSPTEKNTNGESAEAGEPNLYLWEEGTLRFIADLLATDNDNSLSKLGVWHAAPGDRLAQATPDGRFLAFESRAPITGYDSTIAEGKGCFGFEKIGNPRCFEVFEYDAQEGTLICASCRPSGEVPLGPSNLALIGGEKGSFPQPRNLPPTGEGRLFFESQDTLTLADANGHIQDVYEWEPEGVGDCTRAKGCLALISSGTSPKDSHFLDASDSGNDVFFTTRDALVPQDIDGGFLDVYDARVGGGIPAVLNPPCEGQACRGAAPPVPNAPSAASALFSGPGNQASKRCAKGKVRRRARCVKRPRGHHRKRSAKQHRRGGRR
jgi:hypothetical protein